MEQDDDVLATVVAAPGRRWMGVVSLYGLAVLLIYIAFARPPEFGFQIVLLVIGGAALWLADKMRRATTVKIELTREVLRQSDGALIAQVADVQSVDRGFFAFKPSNGFLVRTKTRQGGRVWQPGLWWRAGRQIGVGGVTPASQSKYMSEALSVLIAERDGEI